MFNVSRRLYHLSSPYLLLISAFNRNMLNTKLTVFAFMYQDSQKLRNEENASYKNKNTLVPNT